jgi:hypothetical protein
VEPRGTHHELNLRKELARRHGTRRRYQEGCRCPRCRKANADYMREWRSDERTAERNYQRWVQEQERRLLAL